MIDENEIKVGDYVIATEEANDNYDITREGWVGEVMNIDNYTEEIVVKGEGLHQPVSVDQRFFKKTSKPSSLGGQSLKAAIITPHKQPTSMSKMEEAAMAFRMATEPMKKHQVKMSMIMEVDALDHKHAAQQAEKNYYDAIAGTSVYMPNVVVDQVQTI